MNIRNATDVRLKQLFGAPVAWLHCGIQMCSLYRNAEPSGCKQGILFGVNADAHVVSLAGRKSFFGVCAAEASAIQTVCHSFRDTIVAGGDDPIALNNDRPHTITLAVSSSPYSESNTHIVIIWFWRAVGARIINVSCDYS
jgi:hypothetical protein